MIKTSIEVTGARELQSAFAALPRAMESELSSRIVPIAARPPLDLVRRSAPVLTGALRDSVRIEYGPPSLSILSDLPYAGVADRRTGFMSKNAQATEQAVAAAVDQELERLIDRKLGAR